MNRRRACALLSSLLLAPAFATPSLAQTATWPQRPVRFIVSLGPGSGVDIAARLFADRLSARWGQPVVVENRPGGDAVVAISAMIGARDDHALLFTPTSAFTAHPFQHDKLPYDPREMFPVARIASTLVAIAVPTSLKVDSVKGLIDMVRSQPGKLNYTTATGMTDVIFDGYFKRENMTITRVPYRDTVQALTDLGEGRIQFYAGAVAIVQPHVQAGRVKFLALTNAERPAFITNMPTVAQAGFPELTFDGLTGLFGPREMTSDVKDRIAADIKTVATDPVIVSRLTATGQVILPGTAAEFAASIESQRTKLAEIAAVLGIKPAQ
jgi:tripartite-type tricarboxylate transporter receptor subunit TctC